MAEAKTVTFEDATIIFRNFSGEASKFNKAGDRNFCVVLDDVIAKALAEDGWNVKLLQSREEGEPDTPYLQVKVNFKNRPPRVVTISSVGRTNLKEDTVGVLDYADIAQVDLIIRAYEWDVNDKTGIAAYLQTMFVTINEDELERKYAILDAD